MSWAASLPPKDDNSLLSTNIDRGPYCDHIFSVRNNSTFKSSSIKLLNRLNRQKIDGLYKRKKKKNPKNCFPSNIALFIKKLQTEITSENTANDFSPEITLLFSPGMPCMSVTLLLTKYSLHVALSSGPLQNSNHSCVVTVTLSTTSVFRQRSKLWFCRVRFPNMQTL